MPTTSNSVERCIPTCAGATPTPATPTSSPPNAANAPASAPNDNADGVKPQHKQQPDPPATFVVRALDATATYGSSCGADEHAAAARAAKVAGSTRSRPLRPTRARHRPAIDCGPRKKRGV